MQEYTDAYRCYLNDVGKYDVLNEKEERELTYKIAINNDISARDRLINCNLRLVIDVAKRCVGKCDDFMDVISAGNIGLVKACNNFDYQRGYRFSTYAEYWIMQSIYRYKAQTTLIRYPEHIILKLNRINKVKETLYKELEREPTKDEIAACLENANDVELLDFNYKNIISLDKHVDDDNKVTLNDFLSYNEEKIENKIDNEYVEALINTTLSPQEVEILNLRFGKDGDDMSLQDIGNRYNLTKDVVRNIIDGSLKKLKKNQQIKEIYKIS